MSFFSISWSAQWRRCHGPKLNLFMFDLWHFLTVEWRSLQVNVLITMLVLLPVAISCNHIAMSWSWFLFVSMLWFGNLGSFSHCHSLPSNLCGCINATAFFLCQSKTWTNAHLNILSPLAMCEYACWWLFFNASIKLSVKYTCFPGEDVCWHRNVLSFLWSLYVVYFCPLAALSWVWIFPFYNQKGWGMSDCRGIDPELTSRTAMVRCSISVSDKFRESIHQDITETLQKCNSRFFPLHPSHWERCWDQCLS